MAVNRLAGIALATSGTESSTETSPEVDKLIATLRGDDENARTNAWVSAGDVGAPAVGPLIALMQDTQPEVARAAKRGLWQIVRHSGRPQAKQERAAVADGLLSVLEKQPSDAIQREVLWMLSEIGDNEAVSPMASLLTNPDLREDARMCLERIPGKASLRALKDALESAPQDFKTNIAESLRKRGLEVPEFPSVKLAPSRATSVQAM